MIRLVPLLLCLACAAPSWRVVGGTPAQVADSHAILDASPPLPLDGFIEIVAPGTLDGECAPLPLHVTGCAWVNGVSVTATPSQAMASTALAHELCHLSGAASETAANDCATLTLARAFP